MSSSAYRIVVGLCLGVLLSAGGVHAQTAEPEQASHDQRELEARRSFEQGRAALEVGNFEQALRSFERAYELSGRAELLFNIGTVLDRMRRDGAAARSFERYLEQLPDAANRLAVEARLRVLNERLVATDDARQGQVPSPAEVARREQPSRDSSSVLATENNGPLERNDSAVPLRKKWWFWTAVAVAVGGGAAAAVLLTRNDDVKEAPPILGSQNAFTQALSRR